MTDKILENYYYDEQLKKAIIQFMAIFSGMQVASGKNDYNSKSNFISVPVVYGSKDRVVASIIAGNTQNKMVRVPVMAATLIGLELSIDRLTGSDQVDRHVMLPRGGSLPDDLKVVEKIKPIPYYMRMELSVMASNTNQHFQMLEQILQLFNPSLQLQTSDKLYDWTKFEIVTLDSVTLDEANPAGADRRIITSTFNFTVAMRLGTPINLKENYIKSIHLRLDAITKGNVSDALGTGDSETLIDVDDLDIPPS